MTKLAKTTGRLKVRYFNAKVWRIDTTAFLPFVRALKKAIPVLPGQLNVIFVDDKTIHGLNKVYRGKDKPTDVLSFNTAADPSGLDSLIGEIYISVETTKKQAKGLGQSFRNELNKLFVHGFLHIHGYDHEVDSDYRVMHAIERKILGSRIKY